MSRVAIYHYGDYSLPLLTIDRALITDYRDDIQSFLADTSDIKLAIIEVNYFNLELTVIELQKLSLCTQVIVKSMEIENRILDIIQKFDLPNFVFVLNGYLNFELENATVDQEQFWMNSTSYPYQYEWVDYVQESLHPFDTKPFMFDVLYGKYRAHRDFVNRYLDTVSYRNLYFETPYFRADNNSKNFSNLNFDQTDLWEDDMVISDNWNYHCRYRDREMRISQVLPFKIYNKTSYSIVLETWADNRFSFFTEKIVKPIIARRLFVVISGQHYLRNLQRLGFKTFDGIIDESYDNIEDDQTRWAMAVEQTKWLCQQPQSEILFQIAPIVLHNYAVMRNLDYSKVDQYAESFLVRHGCYKG